MKKFIFKYSWAFWVGAYLNYHYKINFLDSTGFIFITVLSILVLLRDEIKEEK